MSFRELLDRVVTARSELQSLARSIRRMGLRGVKYIADSLEAIDRQLAAVTPESVKESARREQRRVAAIVFLVGAIVMAAIGWGRLW